MAEQQISDGNEAPRVASGKALAERGASLPSTQVLQPESESFGGDEDTINLRELWQVIVRRKWTVVTFFLIVVTSVVTATFLMTPIYRASLTLQIEREAAQVLEFEGVTPRESPNDKDFYQTQYELLKSRTLAERVIDQMGLGENPVFARRKEPGLWQKLLGQAGAEGETEGPVNSEQRRRNRLVNAFLGALTVEPVRNSRLVKIHFESPDPKLAADVVNAIAAIFINLNLERRFDASAYARTFLQERLQQVKAKLEDTEREMVEFARKEEIVNIDERRTISTQRLQEFNAALAKAQQQRIEAEAIYRQMQSATGQGLSQILSSPVIQRLKETKAQLEAEYQDNLRVFKPAYPRMQQLEGQIQEIERKIQEEVEHIRSAIQGDYEAAKANEYLLAAKVEEAKQEVLGLQNRSIQYNILKREVDTNRQLYDGLLQRFKEVGVAAGVGTNNISIVDEGQVPTARYKPSLQLNGLIAVMLGLMGGIGLAFFFEHLDDTVKLPEDLERLIGVPVLGIIPRQKEGRDYDPAGGGLAMVAQKDPRSAFAEAYRSVRTALQFSTTDGAPKVLMVTSSSPGEGKSTTAVNLAVHFAQTGKKVLLIDADLRKPALHRMLNIENGNGLTNHLAGSALPAEITRATVVPNLFVIPSGPLPPNPAELLSSAKMVSLLSLAGERFQHVIVDGPPVLGLADALVLGNLADGSLIVVESGGTRRGHAQGAIKRLQSSRTRVIGGILTKLDSRAGSYSYYHSYYYYTKDVPGAKEQLPV